MTSCGENLVHDPHPQPGRTAGSEEPLLVAYHTVDSPLGPLLLAATQRGLVRVAFESEGFHSVLKALESTLSSPMTESAAALDDAARALDAYFSRTRQNLDLPLDFSLTSGFHHRVQRWLPQIGYGQTATYKDVAVALKNPRAVRAVGTACAKNPLPLFIPCHRVLRSDGGLGGYRGGVAAKKLLLDLESGA